MLPIQNNVERRCIIVSGVVGASGLGGDGDWWRRWEMTTADKRRLPVPVTGSASGQCGGVLNKGGPSAKR